MKIVPQIARQVLGRLAATALNATAMSARALAAPILAGALMGGLLPQVGQAQTYNEFLRKANARSIAIVSGMPGESSLELANDLALVLDCVDGLRIVPVVGKSDQGNIHDLLFLRGIDMAIIPADTLEHVAQEKTYINDLKGVISYVAPMFSQEIHLVAADTITELSDLEGKFVNLGAPGSLALGPQKILANAGVSVIASKYSPQLALERLIDGSLDAMFLIGGKPLGLLERLGDVTGLHLLSLPAIPGEEIYQAARFSHEDYPTLVRAGDEVATLAVPSVLAVYDWTPDNPRYTKNKAFVDALFARQNYLRRPARHPKWAEVDLYADLPGWKRFAAAQALVDRKRASVREAPAPATASQPQAPVRANTPEPSSPEPVVAPVRRASPTPSPRTPPAAAAPKPRNTAAPQAAASVPETPASTASSGPASDADTELERLFEKQLRDYGITPRSEAERAQLFNAFRRRVLGEDE